MTRSFKILSDFDGVWTNQGSEADMLVSWIVRRLGELAERSQAQAEAELGAFQDEMRAVPQLHGWAPDGRICAFIDEDPLVASSSLARFIDAAPNKIAGVYRRAVLAGGFDSLAAFSEHAYVSATAAYRDLHPPCLIDAAGEKLGALHDAGADVVIISNSGADKIASWFQAAGVDAGPEESRLLRVRGSAKKWLLGPTNDSLQVGDRSIFVDRPKYRAAIEAENPDLIVGDVFSLDLALPHVMRQAGVDSAPATLALRRHAHTPTWVTEGSAGGALDHIIDGVEDLAAVVHRAVSA